jgi:hypothetical protein
MSLIIGKSHRHCFFSPELYTGSTDIKMPALKQLLSISG